MQLLLNTGGTGVANAEGRNLKRYYDNHPEDYARYRDGTSVLIPFVGYERVPQWLKRTIFMDFARYEYHRPPIKEEGGGGNGQDGESGPEDGNTQHGYVAPISNIDSPSISD